MPRFQTAAFRSVSAAIVIIAAMSASAREARLTPLVAEVLSDVRPVAGSDGKVHLVYELRLANPTDSAIRIEDIDVLDQETDTVVTQFGQAALSERLSLRRSTRSRNLGPRRGAVRCRLPARRAGRERGAASDRAPDTAVLGQARDGANGDRRVRPHLAGSPHRARATASWRRLSGGGWMLRHHPPRQGAASPGRALCPGPALRHRLGAGGR